MGKGARVRDQRRRRQAEDEAAEARARDLAERFVGTLRKEGHDARAERRVMSGGRWQWQVWRNGEVHGSYSADMDMPELDENDQPIWPWLARQEDDERRGG